MRKGTFFSLMMLAFLQASHSAATQDQAEKQQGHRVFYYNSWVIVSAIGESDFLDTSRYIDQFQYFDKGFAGGPFLDCQDGGLHGTYIKRTGKNDLFSVPWMSPLIQHWDELDVRGNIFWIVLYACVPTGEVFFPFIQSNFEEGFAIIDETVFILQPE